VYVVLFGRGILRRTVRAADDGTFLLADVPAGTCWLRAGDDDFERVRAKLNAALGLDDHASLARPWAEVTVRPGEVTRAVAVPFA
jgi:hypothetical protein